MHLPDSLEIRFLLKVWEKVQLVEERDVLSLAIVTINAVQCNVAKNKKNPRHPQRLLFQMPSLFPFSAGSFFESTFFMLCNPILF